jgi:hypothetical protein
MTTLALFLALAQTPPPPAVVSGVAARASLAGPATVAPGDRFLLDLTGTVSARAATVKVAFGPEKLPVRMLYDDCGAASCALVVATRPGDYLFYTVAQSAGPTPDFDFAFWKVVVTGARPPPEPVPIPEPGPPPPAPPAPAPLVGVPLYAVLVYPNDPSNEAYRALAPVISDPTLAPALASLQVEWRAWPANNAQIDTLKLRPIVGNGTPPTLVIYDRQSNVYDLDGNKVDRSRAALTPPPTSEAVISLFKKLRGH